MSTSSAEIVLFQSDETWFFSVPRPISPSSHRSCVESPPGYVSIMMTFSSGMNPGFFRRFSSSS